MCMCRHKDVDTEFQKSAGQFKANESFYKQL